MADEPEASRLVVAKVDPLGILLGLYRGSEIIKADCCGCPAAASPKGVKYLAETPNSESVCTDCLQETVETAEEEPEVQVLAGTKEFLIENFGEKGEEAYMTGMTKISDIMGIDYLPVESEEPKDGTS